MAPERPLRVLDVGAGLGTGLARMRSWGLFASRSEVLYTGVDAESALVELARERWEGGRDGSPSPGVSVSAIFVRSTLARFAAEPRNRGAFDLVTAQAFLDVVPLAPSVEALARLCANGGLLYVPITFDGESVFEPPHPLDASVIPRYHESMAAAGGDAHSGRELWRRLSAPPLELLELGSSDWVVHPAGGEGGYREDEAFFLRSIVGMVERELADEDARTWAEARYRQIDSAELFYLAHQLDGLARKRA